MTDLVPANRIDGTWPGAPALAGPGPANPGVRTLRLGPAARPMTVELWYPALPGTRPGGTYQTLLRDGVTPVTLHGRAARDALPAPGGFPLVILSHGYPGNRHLMSHLGESLASRGFIVAAADHPGSTYDDHGPFAETLLHRPLDQLALIEALFSHADWGARLIPAAAIVGYSMGAYGAMVAAGAGLSDRALSFTPAPGLERHRASALPPPDPRLKAVVPIGLWGGQHGFWDQPTLAAWRLPCLLVGGDADAISGWDPGIFSVFRSLGHRNQWLLTFRGAGHNAAAPIPAPAEAFQPNARLDFPPSQHYADPVWPTVQMNAALQAVTAAFLCQHLLSGPALQVERPGAGAVPQGFTGPGWENLSLAPAIG